MATKKFILSNQSCSYSPYPPSWGQPWVTVTRQNTVEASAIFSRPRPSPLTATPLGIIRRIQSSGRKPAPYGGEMFLDINAPTRLVEPAAWTPDLAGLTVQARAKMTNRIMDLGESLSGMPGTAKSFAKAMGKLANLFDGASKGSVKQMRAAGVKPSLAQQIASHSRRERRVSSAYLSAMFEWLPLAQDLHDLLGAYAKFARKGDFARAGSGAVSPDGKRTSRVAVGGTVSSAVDYNLNQMGLANPRLTLWQNLPLSFLADWGVNMSTALASMSADVGLAGFSACEISSRETTAEASVGGSWQVFRTDTYVNRTPISSAAPLLNSLRVKPVQLSVTKALLSAALLHQALHR